MGNYTNRVSLLLAGIIALLMAPSGAADAAPMGGTRVAAGRSVCETGYRGMPEYDRYCLVNGTARDGMRLWFAEIDGKRYSVRERRAMCRDARATGSIRRGAMDLMNDVAYDRYRNYRDVLRVTGAVAVLDCRALGIKG
jgi:hypothetical protein